MNIIAGAWWYGQKMGTITSWRNYQLSKALSNTHLHSTAVSFRGVDVNHHEYWYRPQRLVSGPYIYVGCLLIHIILSNTLITDHEWRFLSYHYRRCPGPSSWNWNRWIKKYYLISPCESSMRFLSCSTPWLYGFCLAFFFPAPLHLHLLHCQCQENASFVIIM